jgi:hypothetical protein
MARAVIAVGKPFHHHQAAARHDGNGFPDVRSIGQVGMETWGPDAVSPLRCIVRL